MQKSKIISIFGEMLLTIPIGIVSIFTDLWFEYILVLMCLIAYKLCYKEGYHTERSFLCLLISYGCIITCLIIASVFKKQYVLIIIMCNIICYANYYIGVMQYKAKRFDVIKEPYERLRTEKLNNKYVFDLDNCTESELLIQLRNHKILTKYDDFLIDVFVHKMRIVDYLNAPKNKGKLLDEQQLRNLKCKISKLLKPPIR